MPPPSRRPEQGVAAGARSNRLRWWLLCGSVCVIVYGSLFPFTGWHLPAHGWWSVHAAAYLHASRSDMLANVLLYMPPGFLLALGRRSRSVPLIMLAALVLSLGLETAQAFLPGRVSSLLDAATNTSGAGLGAAAALLLRWPDFALYSNAMARLRHDRVAWIGIAALIVWACAQLIPFVPSLDVGNLKHGLKPLWYALQGSRPVSWWRFAVYAAGTAALTVAGASVLQSPRWDWVAAMFLLAVLPLKALVVERQLSPEALLGTLAGVMIGLALWATGNQRARWTAAILIVVYLMGNAWQPGPAGSVTHPFSWVPLAAESIQPINGMANLADAVWPLLALACLCLRIGMRTLWPLLPLVALLLFGIEWGQHFVPGRYPGITTVLAGVAAWVTAAAYAGRSPYSSGELDRLRSSEHTDTRA